MRGEIMALRQDPTANALMAGVFTNSNAKHLTNKLGRAPTDGELYMAHFMGANGAARLITAAESNPGAVAAQSFSAAARANRSIFFDKSGRARSFAEVTQNLAGRFDAARSRVATLAGAEAHRRASAASRRPRGWRAPIRWRTRRPGCPPIQAAPQVAQAAAAKSWCAGERVFHNPYRTAQRPQPVSPAVTELWAPKSRTTQQEQARHIARDLEQRARPQPSQPVAQAAQTTQASETTQTVQTIQPRKPQKPPAMPATARSGCSRTPGRTCARCSRRACGARPNFPLRAAGVGKKRVNTSAIIAKIYGEPFVKGRALASTSAGGDIVASAC